eukprot:g5964.t1
MSAKLVIFIVLIALCKATLSQKVTSPIVGTNGGVAPLKLGNLEKEICQNDAILYQDCKYQKVVGTVNKKSGNLGFTHTKVWKAVAIEIPKGCKAVLYNELTHYGIHLKGPKKYCSKGVYNDGIHIVSLQDAADVEMVARELVTTENAFKMLEGKVERMSKMKGPKGDQGSKGDQGLKGEQGMPGPKGNKGDKGTKGDQGNQGVQGLKGIDGQKGDKGVQGLKGDKGIQGLKGEQGTPGLGLKYVTFALNKNFVKGDYVFSRSAKDAKHDSMFIAEKSFNSKNKKPYQDIGNWIEFSAPRGRDGEKGEKGDKGVQGDQGNIGPIGHTGPKGDQGIQGPKGDQGIQGPKGDQGLKGDKGATGPKGDKGAQGLKGDRGSIGPRGLRGEIGAYTILNQTAKEGSSPSSRQRDRGAKNSEDQTVGGSRERVFATAGGASSKAKNNETVDLDKNVTTTSSKDSKGNGIVDLDKNITTMSSIEDSVRSFKVVDYETKKHDAIYEYVDYSKDSRIGQKFNFKDDMNNIGGKDKAGWSLPSASEDGHGEHPKFLMSLQNTKPYSEIYKNNVNVLKDSFDFAEDNAEATQCVSFNLLDSISEIYNLTISVDSKGRFAKELGYHCPKFLQYSDMFTDPYLPFLKHTDWWFHEKRDRAKTQRNPVPHPYGKDYPDYDDMMRFDSKKGDCLPKFKDVPFSNGNMLNCFICAVESRLRMVTNKKEETKHHLQHALKVASDMYKVYDNCEDSITCDVMPKLGYASKVEKRSPASNGGHHIDQVCHVGGVTDYKNKCVVYDNKGDYACTPTNVVNKLKTEKLKGKCRLAQNCRLDVSECGLKDILKKDIVFHKKSGKVTKAKNYCKRLTNMHNILDQLKNYFKDAEYGKANTCEPTKHMNLYAENAVEVHVNTTANALTENAVEVHVDTNAHALKFKVSASNPNDIFLNAEDITFDKTKGIVTTVYDCTEDGYARDRCQKSLEFPACTTEETTNIITVSDNQGELSKCTVKVKGVQYELECTEKKGSRRRRLLQGSMASC